jgi:hypothetical protein
LLTLSFLVDFVMFVLAFWAGKLQLVCPPDPTCF